MHTIRPGPILEPALGDGGLIQAYGSHPRAQQNVTWYVADTNPAPGVQAAYGERCFVGDARELVHAEVRAKQGWPQRFTTVLTNPPYAQAMDFVEMGLQVADEVCLLLRVMWLHSAKRHAFLRGRMPDVYHIPDRPSFTGDGRGDACDYAWMVWDAWRPQSISRTLLLPLTSREERTAGNARNPRPRRKAVRATS